MRQSYFLYLRNVVFYVIFNCNIYIIMQFFCKLILLMLHLHIKIMRIKGNYCNICMYKMQPKQNYLNNGSIIVYLLSMKLNKRAAPRAFSIVTLMATQLVDAIQE